MIREEVPAVKAGRVRPGLEIEHLLAAIKPAEGTIVRYRDGFSRPLRVTQRFTVPDRGGGLFS